MRNENEMMRTMSMQELENVNGGIGAIAMGLLFVVAGSFITEFGDVREGLSDGYAGRKPRY